MPSPRRARMIMLGAVVTLVLYFFYSSGIDSSHDGVSQGFMDKTKQAMDGSSGQSIIDAQTGQKAGHVPADKDADGDVDKDDREMTAQTQERLKAAEQEAKDKANKKGGLQPDSPHDVVGVGSSADGQNKDESSGSKSSSQPPREITKEDILAETELKSILKKAPMVIFSKSYCPFSKRAKGILLEKYTIMPEPYVVELDKHPLTSYMQDQLEKLTGRRTVPNIMIKGTSIGGADDIVELDNEDRLVSKIIQLGSGSLDVSERFVYGH